ncbi:hypothetical protein WBG78_14475 [Chryseolinea sp. T2]|uniref:hypothetical protein n=1 Tax=Chryseolinea sp. T2 TaxID=3129255 RepID=UPI003077C60F
MIKLGIAVAAMVVGSIVAYQRMFNFVNTITLARKEVAWLQSPQATAANDYFWKQFHEGNYDSIPVILNKLTTAYVSNPNDIRTITHLGFTHMWALSEHRNNAGSPRSVEHATMAQKYFGESYLMNPNDTRTLSFLSSVKLANGSICGDRELLKDGYLNGQKAIREWENFSSFSLAYTLSRLPASDAKFKEALELMKTLAERHAEDFDPNNADTQAQIASIKLLLDSDQSKDRVFHNSWIAPHNIEGFFMAYGDMLVKSGNWKEGISVYRLCREVRQYSDWDYKEVLERRIVNAQRNAALFGKPVARGGSVGVDDAILVETGIACRSCHQMSEADVRRTFDGYDPRRLMVKKFYFLE